MFRTYGAHAVSMHNQWKASDYHLTVRLLTTHIRSLHEHLNVRCLEARVYTRHISLTNYFRIPHFSDKERSKIGQENKFDDTSH